MITKHLKNTPELVLSKQFKTQFKMKNLFLSLTILSTLFVGCSSDDDEGTIQP